MTDKNESKELDQKGLLDLVGKMQRQIDALQQASGPTILDPDQPTIPTCKVKLWESKPISDIRRVRQVGIDPVSGSHLMECEIDLVDSFDKDGEQKVKTYKNINWSGLVTGEDVAMLDACPFDKMETDATVTLGTVEKIDYQDWKGVGTGVHVPVKIKGSITTFVVQMPTESDLLDKEFLGKKVRLSLVNI